jgi:hypothetical protein
VEDEIDIDDEEEGEIEIKDDDDVCVFVSYHPSSFISHENPTKILILKTQTY